MKLSKCNSNILYLVRIIAAQTVLLGHLFNFFKISPFAEQKYFPHIQSLAVIVFFLLSGFLTDYSAQNKPKGYSFSKYMKAHIFRIYSFFLVALLFIFAIDRLIIVFGKYPHTDSYNIVTFITNFFMLPLVFQPFGSGKPLWTLFIEWWLYIAYGYFFFNCKETKNGTIRPLRILIGCLLFTIPLGSYMQAAAEGAMTIYAFGFGILCNRIYAKINTSKICISFTITLMAFLFSCFYFKNAYHILTVIFLSLLFLHMLVLGKERPSKTSEKKQHILKFLSGTTYPLYLIHYTVIEFFLFTPFIQLKVLQFILSAVVSNLIAILLYILLTPKKQSPPLLEGNNYNPNPILSTDKEF